MAASPGQARSTAPAASATVKQVQPQLAAQAPASRRKNGIHHSASRPRRSGSRLSPGSALMRSPGPRQALTRLRASPSATLSRNAGEGF
jgi:hypothetical protein